MRRPFGHKPKLFAGEFVGGPFHGKYLEQPQPRFRVARRTSLPVAAMQSADAPPLNAAVEMFGEYTWEPEDGTTKFGHDKAIGIWQWRTLMHVPK